MPEAIDFSIVIPTYNRPGSLAACLTGIAALETPAERFEVVVVDDGGATPVDSVVAPFHSLMDVTLLRQGNRGPASARNAGAARARGRFLAFLDDDCRPSPAWLEKLHAYLAAAPDRLVGGRIVNPLESNPCSAASMALISYLYEYGEAAGRNWGFCASGNMAVSCERFRWLGGFDESYRIASEDRDFCDRWLAAKLPMAYAREAVVYHHWPVGFTSFCRRHFTYGRGAAHFRRVRASHGRGTVRVEPPRFYLDLLRYPWRHSEMRSPLAVTALLAISQVAVAAGFFCQRAIVAAGKSRVT
jgi:GT2 family glycosyltransferase